jgi:hypothetical protein
MECLRVRFDLLIQKRALYLTAYALVSRIQVSIKACNVCIKMEWPLSKVE